MHLRLLTLLAFVSHWQTFVASPTHTGGGDGAAGHAAWEECQALMQTHAFVGTMSLAALAHVLGRDVYLLYPVTGPPLQRATCSLHLSPLTEGLPCTPLVLLWSHWSNGGDPAAPGACPASFNSNHFVPAVFAGGVPEFDNLVTPYYPVDTVPFVRTALQRRHPSVPAAVPRAYPARSSRGVPPTHPPLSPPLLPAPPLP